MNQDNNNYLDDEQVKKNMELFNSDREKFMKEANVLDFAVKKNSEISNDNEIIDESENNVIGNLNEEYEANQLIGEDDYLKAYIGKNYDSFKNGGFSWNYFFLRSTYLLYRKMYLAAFIHGILDYFFVVVCICLWFSSFPGFGHDTFSDFLYIFLFNLLLFIIIGFKFKNLYCKFAKKKVKLIVNNNSSLPQQEILEICSKRGGTIKLESDIIIFLGFYILEGILFSLVSSFLNSLIFIIFSLIG